MSNYKNGEPLYQVEFRKHINENYHQILANNGALDYEGHVVTEIPTYSPQARAVIYLAVNNSVPKA